MPPPTFHNHEFGKQIADTFGYSQIAKPPNGAISLAGMLGIDTDMAAHSTLQKQINSILSQIEEALAMVNAKPTDIFKVTSYHLNIESSAPLSATWAAKFGNRPTRTALGVGQLGLPEAQLEVQVEAWPGAWQVCRIS